MTLQTIGTVAKAFSKGAAGSAAIATLANSWYGRTVISLEEHNKMRDIHWEQTLKTNFGASISQRSPSEK